MKRKLVLENGLVFKGIGFDSMQEAVAVLELNYAMVGYQEILSDPASYNKMICMTYPLIGNYGVTDEDFESKKLTVRALVVRQYHDEPSNFRSTETLQEAMEENGVVGIAEVDTRMIARIIRQEGRMKALICDEEVPFEQSMEKLASYQDQPSFNQSLAAGKMRQVRTANPLYTVVVVDYGVPNSLIRQLNRLGCNVVIVGVNTDIQTILDVKPDGIILSDGPTKASDDVEWIRQLCRKKQTVPLLGIGLGACKIALAFGASIQPLTSGKHGSNHPVLRLDQDKIWIATQNSNVGVCEDDLQKTSLTITHRDLTDHSVLGFSETDQMIYGLLFDPDWSNEPKEEWWAAVSKRKGEHNAKKNRY